VGSTSGGRGAEGIKSLEAPTAYSKKPSNNKKAKED
jgi:hypothetical protein